MKKSFLIFLCMLVIGFGFIGCFDDDDDEATETGSIQITVATASKIDGYPNVGSAYEGDTSGKWGYDEVGGTTLADTLITTDDIGNKKFYVYLFTGMEESSKDITILYSGEAEIDGDNPVTITIDDVAVGDYYVVAFYDYASGGKQTNLLNRYDKYAFYYNNSTGYDGKPYSSPFGEDASLVAIEKEITTTIPDTDSVFAKKDWVLGKPNDGEGRLFLTKTDTMPSY